MQKLDTMYFIYNHKNLHGDIVLALLKASSYSPTVHNSKFNKNTKKNKENTQDKQEAQAKIAIFL